MSGGSIVECENMDALGVWLEWEYMYDYSYYLRVGRRV